MKNPLPATTADYHVGETWYSYDNGKTWTDRHFFQEKTKPADAIEFVITKVDHTRGEITVEVGRG